MYRAENIHLYKCFDVHYFAKGQKISKAIFLCFNSSQKPTKKMSCISALACKIGQIKKELKPRKNCL